MSNSFTKYQAEEWLEIIAKDLNGKGSLADLYPEEIEGIKINPFAHNVSQNFDPIDVNANSRNLLAVIDNKNAKEANLLALHFLSNGATAICFRLEENAIIELLLKDIVLDYVVIYLDCRNISDLKGIQSYLSSDVSHPNLKLLNYTNCITLAADTNRPISMLSDCLIKLDRIETNNDECVVEILLGENILIEIAKLRALRILWANFIHGKSKFETTQLKIVAIPNAEILVKEDDNKLIQLTYMAMSSLLGSADYIQLNGFSSNPLYNDIAFHIQNILFLESTLGNVLDPMAGSNVIEDLTNQIATMAWQKFIGVAGM